MKFAVQLYSVRDHIENGDDLLEILGKVKEIGFDGVEFAGYQGLSAETLKAKCDELGLAIVGSHLGLDDFEAENLDATLAFHKALGVKHIGVGGAPHSTYEEAKNTADVLGAANKEAEKLGMNTYYHNHTEEFEDLRDGKNAMDIIGEECMLEVDTYWSFCAGIKNSDYLTKMKDKIALIHIKDGKNHKPTALGEGENDLADIVKGVKEIGLEWVILENDDPVPTGLEDITRSFKWLKENF
jgi:sugar phosphate isomerase/epimerase